MFLSGGTIILFVAVGAYSVPAMDTYTISFRKHFHVDKVFAYAINHKVGNYLCS